MQLWNDFWKWANESQLGAAVVGGLIVAALVGIVAVIPKLRKGAVSAIGRAVRFAASVRITTTNRQAALVQNAFTARASLPSKRVRWWAHMKSSSAIELINTTRGSVARNVSVDAYSGDALLFGDTDFAEIEPLHGAPIAVRLRDGYALLGLTLLVKWENEHGVILTDEVHVIGTGI